MRRLIVLLALAAGLSAAPAALAASFRSPSKNIYCQALSDGLRCDILKHSYAEPRRPASCDLEWGDSVQIGRRGRASLVCHGDTTIDPQAKVVPYGSTWRGFGFACASRTTGMRCTNRDGHGFLLSRQALQRF